MGYVRWTVIFFVSYGAFEAVTLWLAALALNHSFQSLSIPFAMQLGVGLLAGSLIYWARQAYTHPRLAALRFSLAILLSLLLFMPALGLSVVKLDLISSSTAWAYAPAVLPGSLVAAFLIYRAVRKRLEST